MEGVHDMGGREGFGPIKFIKNKPIYASDWERKAHALVSLGRREKVFNMDEFRHAIERMEPRHYMSALYYERMLLACVTLCTEKGYVSLETLENKIGKKIPVSLPAKCGRSNAPDSRAFNVGDEVVMRSDRVEGHHRLPSYVRGKRGVIVSTFGLVPYPDASGHGIEAKHEMTYDVRFRAADLWGDSTSTDNVCLSVFESYIDPTLSAR